MPQHKFKKFERSKTPTQFRIKETDIEILKDLADYRFLDTRQILILHPEISHRTLSWRLQLLFHAGFIDRPILQLSYLRPSRYIIYALGSKGAKLVFPDEKIGINWSRKNKVVKPLFLWHHLMISNFRITLTLALRKTKGSKLINWQNENLNDTIYSEGERLPVSPDAFFTIEDGNDLLHYFLEADRSTMTLERLLKKMRAYWQWWEEQGCQRKFNISTFRVLTITISEQRKENLRQIIKKADNRQQGSEMFLFACEKEYNLEKPETILKPIWQSSKNNNWHHLLE